MSTEELLLLCAVLLSGVAVALLVVVLFRVSNRSDYDELTETLRREVLDEQRESRKETVANLNTMSEMLSTSMQNAFVRQDARLEALTKTMTDSLGAVNERFKSFSVESEQRLDNMRTTMETRLRALQEDNSQKLDKMRETVDEKLQKTLEDKIGQSFRLVSERLEQVYKGLGEMQTLAAGVGDLKKVLSNVKTRGILGEIQLGAILEQIMSREQYDENVATKQGSRDVVEYAVRLPSEDGSITYLPIDAKFPMDTYGALMDAYDAGEPAGIELSAKQLENRIKMEAKDIRDKYIDPPNTTDFAVMFLPVEGLYAEVVRRGMVETLSRDYKVSIAGPTTMAALLNSLQMGFKTLAIQKRSGEVWRVLGAVKTEFDSFAGVLAATQQRLNQANDELDKLVGVRTRQIQKKLKAVSSVTENEPQQLTDEQEDQ
ncbi:MAG: DNA recombination protein RmuC [Oscillospiraceae bacterium]|nr:DNA recombination protein RmuC [Oscillospiraceae bacterium]